jgi:DNA-binding IclR family transcriptional regulator
VLDKAAVLLDALEGGPCTLNELVATTGISRATTHRLAVALEDHGLVRRDDDGRFALGMRLVALGRAAADALPLAEAALPALRSLRQATSESVQLYVRDGDRRLCVAALESPHGLRTIVPLGATLPIEVGSAGKLLLAGRGVSNDESDPDGAITARDQVPAWTESVGEREAGVASVSAPVFDPHGRVIAAVSVSGPIERTTRHPGDRYAESVVAAALTIESALGR